MSKRFAGAWKGRDCAPGRQAAAVLLLLLRPLLEVALPAQLLPLLSLLLLLLPW